MAGIYYICVRHIHICTRHVCTTHPGSPLLPPNGGPGRVIKLRLTVSISWCAPAALCHTSVAPEQTGGPPRDLTERTTHTLLFVTCTTRRLTHTSARTRGCNVRHHFPGFCNKHMGKLTLVPAHLYVSCCIKYREKMVLVELGRIFLNKPCSFQEKSLFAANFLIESVKWSLQIELKNCTLNIVSDEFHGQKKNMAYWGK
jgi:hypothetical protein